jgi:hypothetical protein
MMNKESSKERPYNYGIIHIEDKIGNIFNEEIEDSWNFNSYELTSSLIKIECSLSVEELVYRLNLEDI